ncbi:MAG: hypothetical protein WC807_05765 [Hyphomicrobium sp.]
MRQDLVLTVAPQSTVVLTRSSLQRPLCAIAFGAYLGSIAPAFADVTLEYAPSGNRVVLEVQDATVETVIARLAEDRGFLVETPGDGAQADTFSGRYEGTVSEVLERVLEDENHVIEYSSSQQGGIARIILYGRAHARPGAVQSNAASAFAAAPVPLAPPVLAPIPAASPSNTAVAQHLPAGKTARSRGSSRSRGP